MKTVIQIEGMGCDRCVSAVTAALKEIDGIEVLKVEVGSAEVELADGALLSKAHEAIEDCGFDVVA